jgi:hypothetical protein
LLFAHWYIRQREPHIDTTGSCDAIMIQRQTSGIADGIGDFRLSRSLTVYKPLSAVSDLAARLVAPHKQAMATRNDNFNIILILNPPHIDSQMTLKKIPNIAKTQ